VTRSAGISQRLEVPRLYLDKTYYFIKILNTQYGQQYQEI